VLDDGQSEPGSAGHPGPGLVDPEEPLEDPLLVLRLGLTGTNSTERRVVVGSGPNALVFTYTGTTSNTITGCTRIAGTGNITAGQAITQGYPALNGVASRVWDLCDFAGAAATDEFRISTGSTTPYQGGQYTGSSLLLKANCTRAADPATADLRGYFPIAGFSVPHVSGHEGRRQFAALWMSTYADLPVAIDYVYTDDDLEGGSITWTHAGYWENTTELDAPIEGMGFYADEDDHCGYGFAHVDGIFTRSMIYGRIPMADADDFSAWEYWDGGDVMTTGWSSDPADGVHIGWEDVSALGSNPINIQGASLGFDYDEHLELFLVGYDGYHWRFAEKPWLEWTSRITKSYTVAPNTDPANADKSQAYAYGGFPLQHSSKFTNQPGRRDFLFTQFWPYNVYQGSNLFAVPSPGESEENVTVKDHNDIQRVGDALTLGGTYVAHLEEKRDGWIHDDETWTRVDSLTLTRPGDLTAYLAKYDAFSCHDGTATRYANVLTCTYSGGTLLTTVTLIPHNDGASAGNILSSGTITAPRYSHEDKPVGFPGSFTYTCTPTGFSAVPTNVVYAYSISKGRMRIDVREVTAGTSNNASHTYPLPAGCAVKTRTNYVTSGPAQTIDAGINSGAAQWGVLAASSGGTALTSQPSPATGNWTASGGCRVGNGHCEFELA